MEEYNIEDGLIDYSYSFANILNGFWTTRCSSGYKTIKTGFSNVDSIVKGWHPGELCFVGGVPRMGKTAFLISVATNLARKDVSVALFSATDTVHPAFLNRIVKTLQIKDHINLTFDNTPYTGNDFDELPLYLFLKPKLTFEYIAKKAMAFRETAGLEVIFIDSLQSLYESKHGNTEDTCYQLKELALEIGVPIIVSSELGEEYCNGAYRRPIATDIKDSALINDIADSIYLLHRPDYYNIYEDDKGYDLRGLMELLIVKNRYGGTGNFRLGFKHQTSTVFDLAGNNCDKALEEDVDLHTQELLEFLSPLDNHKQSGFEPF